MEEKHQINEELDNDMFYTKDKYIYIDRYGVVHTTDKLYFIKDEDE
ncbi:hypothetical protein ABEV41_00285 [Geobacillus thermodenitrificans]